MSCNCLFSISNQSIIMCILFQHCPLLHFGTLQPTCWISGSLLFNISSLVNLPWYNIEWATPSGSWKSIRSWDVEKCISFILLQNLDIKCILNYKNYFGRWYFSLNAKDIRKIKIIRSKHQTGIVVCENKKYIFILISTLTYSNTQPCLYLILIKY